MVGADRRAMGDSMTNAKTTLVNGQLFAAWEETDDLGDVKVRIFHPIWQSSSRWHGPHEALLAWHEAESKLPFTFNWTPAEVEA
jgi:hypothetical protein